MKLEIVQLHVSITITPFADKSPIAGFTEIFSGVQTMTPMAGEAVKEGHHAKEK